MERLGYRHEAERRIPLNTAEPPPEVSSLIREVEMPGNWVDGWLAVPAITPPLERLRNTEIWSNQVDAVTLLEPFFGRQTALWITKNC